MRVRFLLGPAGSGKTFRCLSEIREALISAPDGPPLLLLAPKQATFQLERQLLEDDRVAGWTRLQVLSFERLAMRIAEEDGLPELLNEDGRIMVLRALLRRHQSDLRVFRSAARLTGFARELSSTFRDLQHQGVGPARIEEMAAHPENTPILRDKLHDLGLLLREYRAWLKAHALEDLDVLPEIAVSRLEKEDCQFHVEALWLDGFAEMTPQEVELLAALVARSRETTLAFCADQPFAEDSGWSSPWAMVSQTIRRVHARVAAFPGCDVTFEVLPRRRRSSRFVARALAHLERTWAEPDEAVPAGGAVRMVACSEMEREAEVAAREILREVRAGTRFGHMAVLVRSLEEYHAAIRRVFARYEIPCFIDRRAPLAHHPLAELTRCAIRLRAVGWSHEDWFGALKTGLTPAPPDMVDVLENEALAHGWDRDTWLNAIDAPLPAMKPMGTRLRALIKPWARFLAALSDPMEARALTTAIRQLWDDLGVFERMEAWATEPDAAHPITRGIHDSAREQIEAWLENLERGFAGEALSLSEWPPIVDAGLASLTAGVIPPAMDQVLIGAVDRSRNPELEVVIVMGLNEGRFPAPPRTSTILNENDRDRLRQLGVAGFADWKRRVGHERYFGYIACTRARRRLVLTWSERDEEGRSLNPSPFIRHVTRVLSGISVERDESEGVPVDLPSEAVASRVEHSHELLPWLLNRGQVDGWVSFPGVLPRGNVWRPSRGKVGESRLHPGCARLLHGQQVEVSVSALESMAACPFQFFIQHGLRGKERVRFEVDPRRTGMLSHELLARFHHSIAADGLRWRDLDPDTARDRFNRIASEWEDFGEGVCIATPEARWRVERLVANLREFVAVLVGWAQSSGFDPVLAEVEFGGRGGGLPAWAIEVENGGRVHVRGKVDRVDVCHTETGQALFQVIDYKQSLPRLDDALIKGGVDLQLAAYLLALMDMPGWWGNGPKPSPAGMFYVPIRERSARARTRAALQSAEAARRALHVHRGRFQESALECMDRGARTTPSGQYYFAINRDGSVRRGGDCRRHGEWGELLSRVRWRIRQIAEAILTGEISVSPFRKGTMQACQRCSLAAICRFDPWMDTFRRLDEPRTNGNRGTTTAADREG